MLDLISEAITGLYYYILTGPKENGIIKIEKIVGESEECLEIQLELFNSILDYSLKTMQVWDLETGEFSTKIKTSVETDIGVLRASCDLVKLLISGNQCIFLDTFLNSAEEVDI